LGLRPVRELDDGPFATPLPHADGDRDDARDDGDRTAHVQEERDVVQEDDEEQAEEQGETAHREVGDRVEIQQARRARRHDPSDEGAGTSIRRRQNQERAADPVSGSRMNNTPAPEIPMRPRAITANAIGPSACVKAPPRTGPTMSPDPKMIE